MKNPPDSCPPFLYDLHTAEYIRNNPIPYFRTATDGLFQCKSAIKHTGRGNLYPVIVDSDLYAGIIHIVTMTYGIDDHFPDSSYGKFIGVFSDQTVDFSPQINMTENKLIGIFYLFIQTAIIFFLIYKEIPFCSFK